MDPFGFVEPVDLQYWHVVSVLVALVLSGVVVLTYNRIQHSNLAAAPPEFFSFQKRYLCVYLLCTFSDWLKGPYVYALYEQYGFSQLHIAWLFIGGFLSSLVFGTVVGSMSDSVGRKTMCLVYCGTYAFSAMTKVVNNFWVLFLGRVLGGIATSLLCTCFESWMVAEHRAKGFPDALLTNTFSKSTAGNGIVAIVAGIVAQVAATCCGFVAPFLVAIPCLALASLLMMKWDENYGCATIKWMETVRKGFDAIRREQKLQALGICQSLFEGCLFVWVFYWTPCLSSVDQRQQIPIGLVFSCFMASLMVGGVLTETIPIGTSPLIAHLVSVGAMILAAVTHDNKLIVFLAFVVFEGVAGLYFGAHGTLRSAHIEETSRSAVMNMFRVPLNIFVIVFLQYSVAHRNVMAWLAVFHAASLLGYLSFLSVVKNGAKGYIQP